MLALGAAAVAPSLLAGCDPHAEDEDTDGPDDAGDAGSGTDTGTDTGDGGTCELDTPPPGAALLDAANCIHQDTGVVFASCSSVDPMLRPCDVAFMEWCNAYGGDVEACAEDEILAREHRCGGGPAFLPCDPTFTAACDGADGVFACDDPAGDDCLSGSCAQPPEPLLWCCQQSSGPGSGGLCKPGLTPYDCTGDYKIVLNCTTGETCTPAGEDTTDKNCECHNVQP